MWRRKNYTKQLSGLLTVYMESIASNYIVGLEKITRSFDPVMMQINLKDKLFGRLSGVEKATMQLKGLTKQLMVSKEFTGDKLGDDVTDGIMGKILLMDKEESVRVTVKLVLQRMNYEVETANDANEAIDLYKRAIRDHKPFDAVIMDLIVPDGMGGGDAVTKLIEIDPEIKVIVSSGNVDDPILKNFEEYGISAFLLKPFKIDSLRKTLHEVTMGNMNSGVVSWFYKDY